MGQGAAGEIRQVVIPEPGILKVATRERPRPAPGEVLVRTATVGICGSDLHALAGVHPFIPLPAMPGHEVAGVVEAVGTGVSGVTPGDRVLVEANLVCGRCLYCRSGRYNLCESLLVFGCQTTGAMADVFTVPAGKLHQIPEGMDDTRAVLVEPMSTCTHATRLASDGDLSGKAVAILGAGSIGLLLLIAAQQAGAEAVAVTELVPSKRQRALRLGAAAAVDGGDPQAVLLIRDALGRRPDVTFDCVANQRSMDQAMSLAHKGASVVVVGVPVAPVTIALPLLQDREVLIRGCAMYVREDVLRAMELLEGGAVPVEQIVTSEFPLDNAADAFAAARRGDQVKVLLHP